MDIVRERLSVRALSIASVLGWACGTVMSMGALRKLRHVDVSIFNCVPMLLTVTMRQLCGIHPRVAADIDKGLVKLTTGRKPCVPHGPDVALYNRLMHVIPLC